MWYDYIVNVDQGRGWKKLPKTMTDDTSRPSRVIREAHDPKTKRFHVNLTTAAKDCVIDRSRLIAKLQDWQEAGYIRDLKGHIEHDCYRIVNQLPSTEDNITAVADAVHASITKATEDDILRIRDVFNWATGTECLARGLSLHFGDEDPFPGETGCGNCSVCRALRTSGSGLERSAEEMVDDDPTPTAVDDPTQTQDRKRKARSDSEGASEPASKVRKVEASEKGNGKEKEGSESDSST